MVGAGRVPGRTGGCLAIVAYAAAVARLGAGLAALFPALVPPLAVLLAVPMTGSWPSLPQSMGIALATLGLVASLDAVRSATGRIRGGR